MFVYRGPWAFARHLGKMTMIGCVCCTGLGVDYRGGQAMASHDTTYLLSQLTHKTTFGSHHTKRSPSCPLSIPPPFPEFYVMMHTLLYHFDGRQQQQQQHRATSPTPAPNRSVIAALSYVAIHALLGCLPPAFRH
ncbi:hypothetical protein F5B17DRAFT_388715 [Nemania serpens]|nr:hypothetical protein F5B17DRAFT_388715 [Nemania serpens]